MKRLFYFWLSTCVLSLSVRAHVLDQYLQTAQITLAPEGVQIELRLVPGIKVAQSIIALIDTNGDGKFVEAERHAYAEKVRQGLTLKLNRQLRPLRLAATNFPTLPAMREGTGTIRLTFQSETDLLKVESQQLEFQNYHLPLTSVYLANALVPSSGAITIQQQQRDELQRELRIDFRVAVASPVRRWWLLLGILLGSTVLLARQSIAAFVRRSLRQKLSREFMKTRNLIAVVLLAWSGFIVVVEARRINYELAQTAQKKGVMLMNRIGPSASELMIANADGTNERKLFASSGFDYHASFSADGKWIVFTSERTGDGQADIYRVHTDGSALEQLTDSPATDDQGALSPDGTQLAFVSSRTGYKTNIWLLDLKTKRLRNLTGQKVMQGDPTKPGAFLRPSWSPDGKWLTFSSDRNTEWTGHSNGRGWEHLQELSLYVTRPNGKDFRRIYAKAGFAAGAPKWSPDGKQIVFYELPVEQTWKAHWPGVVATTTSQIVSVNVATGERTERTSGPGLKVAPQFLPKSNDADAIGYLIKAGPNEGVGYVGGPSSNAAFKRKLRSPSWSPDGKTVVYEQVSFKPRAQNKLLYSWDANYEYRYTDVFPSFSKDGKLLVTDKNVDSSIAIMDADGSHKSRPFVAEGGSAFAPSWSPDGQWIVFGFGGFLQDRYQKPAKLMLVKRDGTDLQSLTEGEPNTGFPSYSADGKQIVYRVWGGKEMGLRIMTLADRSVRVLTNDYDNNPYWSPTGERIVFARKVENNYDVYTIKPDGTDLKRLTTSLSNDAHAVWTDDGQHILYNSGQPGWKDEAAHYDNTFQPYGVIMMMKADGTEKRQLTDSPWEDSMPCFVPKAQRH